MRLSSVEDCSRQNANRLNNLEELIMKTVGPIRELLVPNVEVTEIQVCREQAEFDLDQNLDAFIDSTIDDDEILKNIRSACMANDYAGRFKSHACQVGQMLCPRPPTRKLKVADEDIYVEHGKMRKLFSTFVANVFAAAGERFVLTKEHASQQTSCGIKYYSALVIETVAKKIFSRLFFNRSDLQYWKIGWQLNRDDEEEVDDDDEEGDEEHSNEEPAAGWKRTRRHPANEEEDDDEDEDDEEVQLRSVVSAKTLRLTGVCGAIIIRQAQTGLISDQKMMEKKKKEVSAHTVMNATTAAGLFSSSWWIRRMRRRRAMFMMMKKKKDEDEE
eukprot:scaffold1611_cov175-Ochromonas_danica.AAC.1